jgi:hypothetical protein
MTAAAGKIGCNSRRDGRGVSVAVRGGGMVSCWLGQRIAVLSISCRLGDCGTGLWTGEMCLVLLHLLVLHLLLVGCQPHCESGPFTWPMLGRMNCVHVGAELEKRQLLFHLLLKRREPGTPCAAAYLRTAAEARFTSIGVSWSKGWSAGRQEHGRGLGTQATGK